MAGNVESLPSINALSFQEKTLRAAKGALLREYSAGPSGRGIGFVELPGKKPNQTVMSHSFLNFGGFHQIERPENQLLPLLFMGWSIAGQYRAHASAMGQHAPDANVVLTVISDTLSGDDSNRRDSEQLLKWLLDADADTAVADPRIVVTHSFESDKHPGDLLADNLAGWLNAAISDPSSKVGRLLFDATLLDRHLSWNELLPSTDTLHARQVVSRRRQQSNVPIDRSQRLDGIEPHSD
jgi:hypothetical protein